MTGWQRASSREIVLDIPVEHERNIFGGLDLFLKKIERSLQVDVIARDGKVKILGSDSQTKKAERVLQELLELSKRGSEITEQNVDYIISMTMQEATESYADLDKEILGYTVQGKPIKAKTYGQQKYVRAIQEKMMVFGIVRVRHIWLWPWQSRHLKITRLPRSY